MKKIVEYRKLLNVDKTVALKDLKTIYRNAMKESHPDKFQGDDAGLLEAEQKSKEIIEAHHFLVSINPETIKNGLPEFNETIANSTITDYKYENIRLSINFSNKFIWTCPSCFCQVDLRKDTFLMLILTEK